MSTTTSTSNIQVYFLIFLLVLGFAALTLCKESPIHEVFHTIPANPSGNPGDNGKHKGRRVKVKKADKHRETNADPEQDIDSTELP